MNNLPFDPQQLSALLGVSPEEAGRLMQAAEVEIQRRADEVVAGGAEQICLGAVEQAALRAQARATGVPFEQLLEQAKRGRAFAASVLAEQRARGTRISPDEIAECLGGDLPKGWDDLLPKDLIDERRGA